MQAGPSTYKRQSWQTNGSRPVQAEESDYDSDASSSSEDVTEDEEGADLTPALDAAILRTLGKIRRGEGVYGSERVLEEELQQATAEALRRGVKARQVRQVEAKPFLLADHHRNALLEGRGQDGDMEANELHEEEGSRPYPVPYAQEQRRMRKEAIDAFRAAGDDEEGEFLPVQKGSGEGVEGEKEDEEYRKFLLEMGGGEEEVRKLLGMGDSGVSFIRADDEEGVEDVGDESGGVGRAGKKEKKDSEKKKKKAEKKVKADDEFLMKGWVDKVNGANPTYDDIVLDKTVVADEDSDDDSQAGPSHPWGLLDEDEFDEKADEFETEYNFRFEEPGSSNIHSHPRQIDSLVRRPDDARKIKRQERAERKAAEQAAKEEETRKVKGKKRREMDSQLEALRKEVGEKEWAKVEQVLEGEFDEGVWERVVGGLLSGLEGDGSGNGDEGDDDEKPTWDEDEDDEAFREAYGEDHEGEGEPGAEEVCAEETIDNGPINMDADFVGLEPGKKKRKKDKKGKKKNRAEGDDQEEEPQEALTVKERAEKVKQAMEEYKALDHEDMIGDLPTRFHYTKSAPLTYGLTPAEILLATDSELNQLMSVKHIAPYRSNGLGTAGKGLGKRVRDLKDNLKERRWGEEYVAPKEQRDGGGGRTRDQGWPKRSSGVGAGGEGEGEGRKKRMGKNERKRKAAAMGINTEEGESNEVPVPMQVSSNGANWVGRVTGNHGSARQATDEGGQGGEGAEGGGGGKKRRRKKKSSAAAQV